MALFHISKSFVLPALHIERSCLLPSWHNLVGKKTALSSDRSDNTTKKLLHPLPLTAEEDVEAISLLAFCELHRTINFPCS